MNRIFLWKNTFWLLNENKHSLQQGWWRNMMIQLTEKTINGPALYVGMNGLFWCNENIKMYMIIQFYTMCLSQLSEMIYYHSDIVMDVGGPLRSSPLSCGAFTNFFRVDVTAQFITVTAESMTRSLTIYQWKKQDG